MLLLVAAPALAQPSGISPLKFDLGQDWTAHLGGDVNLTGFSASQGQAHWRSHPTASIFANARIDKLFANEWRVGVATKLNLYHDRFSGDNYGNRFFAKAYGFVHTPYGELEIGRQDGAAYTMAITGPLIAPDVAIDDANIGFFVVPGTGSNLRRVFALRSAVFSTSNSSKLSYFSPRLLGVQLGVSFTPSLAGGPLPVLGAAPAGSGRQHDLVDAALNYTGYFGRTSLGLYAGVVHGQLTHAQPGQSNLLDWGIGGELDYAFSDSLTGALGGAYRQSNTYVFDPFVAAQTGQSDILHGSATLVFKSYKFGIEYSDGTAGAALGFPHLHLAGYELSTAYVVNRNLQLTLGFQHERFVRASALLNAGASSQGLNAVFLFARLHV
jgi:hypothetical protein